MTDSNVYILRIAALLFSLPAAFLMNSYVILERRVAWQPCMMMLAAAVAFNVQSDISAFLSMLLPVILMGLLFRLDDTGNIVLKFYTLFAVAATFVFFFPQLLIFLPLLLLYPALSGKLSARSFFAALLGVITPLWIATALVYLFPSLALILESPMALSATLWQTSHIVLSPAMLMMLIAEFVVAFPAMIHFFVTASIGRTHLRRRMIFCIVSDIVLWLAGWLCPELLLLFFVWRLPIYSLLSAYIFSVLPPKTSNIYIILSLLLWLASMVVEAWIG